MRRQSVRKALVLKLGGECAKCKSNIGLEIDHIRPIRTQDKLLREWDLRHPDMDNLQLLCYSCHQDKSNIDNKSLSKRITFFKMPHTGL